MTFQTKKSGVNQKGKATTKPTTKDKRANTIKKPTVLVNDDDYAPIDVDRALIYGALADSYNYKKRFKTGAQMEALYEKAIGNFIWNEENQPNQVNKFQPEPFSRNIY